MMKRIIYITLAAVALLLSACSERPIDPMPQVPGSTGSYIFFEPEVIESVETKTTMVEGTTLPGSFGVYGYAESQTLFNGNEVYKNSDGYFTYDNLVRWVDGTTPHNFYAYYPYSLDVSVSNNKPYIAYTQPTTQSSMIDILTANKTTQKMSVVDLTFQHRLWAMDITIKNNREQDDLIYNPDTGNNDLNTGKQVKAKSIKIEFDDIPASASLYLDGDIQLSDNRLTFTKDYPAVTLEAGKSSTLNGQDSFLFLPCPSFKYRITIEFENTWGVSYIAHHPSTYKTTEDGEPDYDSNGQIQWDWATAKGPNSGGFNAGYRYTLDIVKSDYDLTFVWDKTEWGEWDEIAQKWVNIKVEHTFN